MYNNAGYIFLNSAPEADSTQDAVLFAKEAEYSNKRLVESAKSFNCEDIQNWKISEVCWVVEYFRAGLRPQSSYTEMPFRNYEYDKTGTVATSGGALLVATFVEFVIKGTQSFALEELADAVAEKGYIDYKEGENGEYTPLGCKPIFFDKFVPAVYRLDAERAESVQSMLEAIGEYNVVVILVKDSIYKKDPNNNSTRFLTILGFNENELVVFDPDEDGLIKVGYDRIVAGLEAGWVFKKRKR